MEEIYELRAYIESGHYKEALLLLDEMEEMSRDDKINRISSFMEVLLVHLIKQAAEQRTTRPWDVSGSSFGSYARLANAISPDPKPILCARYRSTLRETSFAYFRPST